MSAPALLLCLVVGVTDGDTIKVRCGEGPQERVRLAQIDAPESGQPHGKAAKQALSQLVYGKEVLIDADGRRDRYGRLVGQVRSGEVHVNAALVAGGWAWCYDSYKPGPWCAPAEEAARGARRGLWAEPDPVPPWEWRKARR